MVLNEEKLQIPKAIHNVRYPNKMCKLNLIIYIVDCMKVNYQSNLDQRGLVALAMRKNLAGPSLPLLFKKLYCPSRNGLDKKAVASASDSLALIALYSSTCKFTYK